MTSNDSNVRAWPWLVAGAGLIAAANFRWGVGVLAWIAPVPMLQYLRRTRGWRSRLALVGAVLIGWLAAVSKIITEPVPPLALLGVAVPMALLFAIAYLAWDGLRRRADDWRAVLAFPSLMIAAEWIQHELTPFASWGAAAYSQVDDLPLLQLASLVGIAGVGWIVYAVAASIDRAWVVGLPAGRRWIIAAAALVIAPHVFGAIRLATADRPAREAHVAAVITDNRFGTAGIPSDEEVQANDDALFDRTASAARAGAEIVVWNEIGTVVEPEREQAFLARAAEVASDNEIELVVAYALALSWEPMRYENKYVWLRPDGTIDHVYHKHEPTPGEPAVRGTAPPRAVSTTFGRATGALCYDYDFPYLARSHARLGVDVVVVPSSDWRGIDPIHTQMASVRAIEGGFSLVRSTRMGMSAAVDPYGRVRASLSSFDSGDRVMLATVPAVQVPTLYAHIGDVLVYVAILYVLALIVLVATMRTPAAARPR